MTTEHRVWATQIMNRSEHMFSVYPIEEEFDRTFYANHRELKPVGPELCPAALYVKKGRIPKDDIFTMVNGIIVVSTELADIIESFDTRPQPGADDPDPPRTQLLRMPLVATDRQMKLRDVAVLYVRNEKGSFLPDKSETNSPPDYYDRYGMFVGEQKLVVDGAALRGADIWRERYLANAIFFSDRLRQEMADAKMKPMKALHACEVMVGDRDQAISP